MLVCVSMGVVAGVSVAVPAGAASNGSIDGVVVNSGGAALPNVTVEVFGAYYGNLIGSTTTDAAGSYAITNVPPIASIVEFSDPAGAYVTQYGFGAANAASAARVTAPPGGVLVVNATLVANRGALSGHVYGTSAGPLGNVLVTAFDSTYGTTVATTTIAADGSYTFADLPATNYVLEFVDPTNRYAPYFYRDHSNFAGADRVAVLPQTTVVADVFLVPAQDISGNVRDQKRTPLSGIAVILVAPTPPAVVTAAVTDANGNYTLGPISPHVYKVVFVDPVWAHDHTKGFRPQFAGGLDASDPATLLANLSAAPVVSAGSTSVNASLLSADCTPATFTPGVSMAGKHLAGCDLHGMNLTGADLTGADLSGCNLTWATLINADLRGADLTGADLSFADVAGADLTGARLTGTQIGPAKHLKQTVGLLSTKSTWQHTNLYSFSDAPNQLDLSGADLSNLDLTGTNFGWVVLHGTNFAGSNLTASNFYAADAQAAVWTAATVRGATFNPLNLGSGVDVLTTKQTWQGTTIGNIDLTGADLHGLDLTGFSAGTVLAGADLSNSTLTNANLRGDSLVGANLAGAVLTGANFGATDLTGANITGTRFAGSVVTDVNFTNAIGINSSDLAIAGVPVLGANFTGTYWDLSGRTLTGFNFRSTTLATVDLSNADLTSTSFYLSALAGANFTGATVRGASFSSSTGLNATIGFLTTRATWQHVDFGTFAPGTPLDASGADLSGLDFTSTNFGGANLAGANLLHANFTNAVITGVNFTGATNINLSIGLLTTINSPPYNVYGTDWYGTDFTGTGLDLHGVDLHNVGLSGAILVGANLSGANLSGALLPAANLSRANLSGATATGIVNDYQLNLSGAVLTGADLTGSDFSTATLTGVTSGGIIGVPTPAYGWSFFNGYFVGRGANLTNANLSGADLTGRVLTGANLAGANLSATTLTGVSSGAIVGTPVALPAGWALVNGYLMGAGANASGASLPFTNLSGMNLAGINLSGAQLGWVNLTNTNLTGADLSSANLGFAKLTGANLSSVNLGFTNLHGSTGTPIYATASFFITTCPDGVTTNLVLLTCRSHPWP